MPSVPTTIRLDTDLRDRCEKLRELMSVRPDGGKAPTPSLAAVIDAALREGLDVLEKAYKPKGRRG